MPAGPGRQQTRWCARAFKSPRPVVLPVHCTALQAYLKSLLEAAQCVARGTGTQSHARIAVRCLTTLLASHPHFNYTSDILQVGGWAL